MLKSVNRIFCPKPIIDMQTVTVPVDWVACKLEASVLICFLQAMYAQPQHVLMPGQSVFFFAGCPQLAPARGCENLRKAWSHFLSISQWPTYFNAIAGLKACTWSMAAWPKNSVPWFSYEKWQLCTSFWWKSKTKVLTFETYFCKGPPISCCHL